MSNFNSKEEYLTFISIWKSAANAPECKPVAVPCDLTIYEGSTDEQKVEREALGYKVSSWYYTIPDGAKCKPKAWLQAEHYLLRNIMLGKDPMRGFTKVTAKRKLDSYWGPWRGFKSAISMLGMQVRQARRYLEKSNDEECLKWINAGKKTGIIKKKPVRTSEEYYKSIERQFGNVIDFIKPFNGFFTMTAIAAIDLKELDALSKSLTE